MEVISNADAQRFASLLAKDFGVRSPPVAKNIATHTTSTGHQERGEPKMRAGVINAAIAMSVGGTTGKKYPHPWNVDPCVTQSPVTSARHALHTEHDCDDAA